MEAEQDDLTLSHKRYITNCALSKDDQPEDVSEDVSKIAGCDYRRLLGSISYLAITTRPDLAFAAHILSRFLNNHSQVHWQAAKHAAKRVAVPKGHRRRGHHILAELRGTLERVLRRGLCELQGRPQKRDWILFQYRSGAISWSVKKQTCMDTSTTEAEVHVLSEAIKEALHLQGILECIGETKQRTILSDSQSRHGNKFERINSNLNFEWNKFEFSKNQNKFESSCSIFEQTAV